MNAEKIKRHYCGNGEGMFEDDNGTWVKYEDHLNLIEEYAKQSKKDNGLREAAENVVESWSEANATGNKADIMKLERSIEQLVKAMK